MTKLTEERLIAGALAFSIAAQGAWMGLWSGGGWQTTVQWLLVAALASAAAYQAWMARGRWPAHADMLLLMAGLGGLGMMIGGWVDAGFPMQPPMGHHHHHHAITLAGVCTWMVGFMLLFAVPPSAVFSRCLAPIRRKPLLLAMALALDCTGMIIGMFLAAAWWGMPLMHWTGSHFAGHHLAMLIGMLGGMIPAMLLRDLILRLLERRAAARAA